MGPQGCEEGEPLAPPIDASTVAVAEGSIEAGPITDGGASDGDATPPIFGTLGPANAPLFFNRFGSEVNAIVHAGSSWYIGGRGLTQVTRHAGPGLMQLSTSGTPVPCLVGAGFGDAPSGGGFMVGDGGPTGEGSAADPNVFPPNQRIHVVLHVGDALYVGGTFTHYRADPAQNLAKLDATTCALDKTFTASTGFAGTVLALAVHGASLYVGGRFDAYRGAPAHRVAKLDAGSGALDTAFTRPGGGFDHPVEAIIVRGSALYAGGSFENYRGVSARALAKLDLSTGDLDAAFKGSGFDPDAMACDHWVAYPDIYEPCMRDVRVTALAASDSALYVGGRFTEVDGHAVGSLAKLDLLSGAVDTTFSPAGATAFERRPRGFSDAGAASTLAPVNALALSGSSLYVGGTFTGYRGVNNAAHIAKLDATSGALDPAFSPANNGFDGVVRALALADGALFVGGAFDGYRGVAGAARGIAKLDLGSGALDTSFKPAGSDLNGFDGDVEVLAAAGDSVWAAGTFSRFGGHSVKNLVKVDDTTFEVDTTFTPPGIGFDGAVEALAVSGASLYVGGSFTSYRGVAGSASRLAKLDLASGALDTTFSPPGSDANGFDDKVSSLAIDGTSLYVGGRFKAYRGAAGAVACIAKLDATSGALDPAFTPPGVPNGFEREQGPADVLTLVVDASSVYAGGTFNAYRGVARSANNIAKLARTTGELDTTFSPPSANGFTYYDDRYPDGEVRGLHLAGGSLFVRGRFMLHRGMEASGTRVYNYAVVDPTTGALRFEDADAGVYFIEYPGPYGDYFVSSSDALYVATAKLDPTTGTRDPGFLLGLGPVDHIGAAGLHGGQLYLAGEHPFALLRFDAKTGAPE